jgi:hypothetical protein
MIAVIGCHARIGRRTAKVEGTFASLNHPTNMAEAVVWMQEPSSWENYLAFQFILKLLIPMSNHIMVRAVSSPMFAPSPIKERN